MFGSIITTSSIYQVFRPIFLLTRLCCMLPIRIRKSGVNITVKWSWVYYVVSIVGLVFLVCMILYGLVMSYQIEDVYNVRMKQFSGMFITILDDSYLIITFVSACTFTPFTFRHYCRYMMSLNEVDRFLKFRPTSIRRYYCMFFLTLVLTLGVLIFDIYMWGKVFTRHVTVWVFLVYTVPFYFTYFVVMVIELNYWFMVHAINARLTCLNERMRSKYIGTKSGQAKGVKIVSDVKEKVTDQDLLSFTKYCMKTYESLYEASSSVNDFYGMNILLVIIGCLIHLLVTPYDLYLEKMYHDTTFIFPQFCWMISHVLRLLLVVEPCHVATQQVKIANVLLCRFFSRKLSKTEQLQFKTFATQLLHCPIQFTACDLFVLNRSLLTAIAGGVTTYLVILFQFENQ